MVIEFENGRLWHTDCTEPHGSGIMKERCHEYRNRRTLLECLHCGKLGYYPHVVSGKVCVDELPNR